MAVTRIQTTNLLRKHAWEEVLFRDTMASSFFMSRFASPGLKALENGFNDGKLETTPNEVLHIKTDLGAQGRTRTSSGDKITFGLIPRIDPKVNAGVTSGQTLKGKEIALTPYNYSLELQRYRQAVSGGSSLDWDRASFNLPKESRAALEAWGRDKMELLCFQALESDPANIFYSTNSTTLSLAKDSSLSTAKSNLVSGQSKLTTQFISAMKAWAKTGGGRAGGQIPLRPIIVDGKPYYIFLTHPDAIADWKVDNTFQNAAQYAAERGINNPLFTGASFIWDGVIIHEHEYVTTGTDAGTNNNVPWTYGHLLGAQALCVAFGERPSIVEDTDDYDEDLFFAWRMTMAVGRPKFNGRDYGSMTCIIERTNISGV